MSGLEVVEAAWDAASAPPWWSRRTSTPFPPTPPSASLPTSTRSARHRHGSRRRRTTLRQLANPVLLDYLRDADRTAEMVTSVCTGSLLLAGAGLLQAVRRPPTGHHRFQALGRNLRAPALGRGRPISDRRRGVCRDRYRSAARGHPDQRRRRAHDPTCDRVTQPPHGIDWPQVDRDSFAPRVEGFAHQALDDHPELLARLLGSPALRSLNGDHQAGLGRHPTEQAEPTVAFFRDLLGLRPALQLQDFWVLKLPDGSKVGSSGPTAQSTVTSPPVPSRDSWSTTSSPRPRLRAAGVEILLEPELDDSGNAWVHWGARRQRLRVHPGPRR